MERIRYMRTYREVALERLMSIGIKKTSAEKILNVIINECDYAPQVFSDFTEDLDDNWDTPVIYL